MTSMLSTSLAALAAGALISSATLETASAKPFAVTDSLGGGATSDVLGFDLFDPANGTLTGVSFSLTQTTQTSASVALTGSEGSTASTNLVATFSIEGPLGTSIINGTAAVNVGCSVPFSGTTSCINSTATSISTFGPLSVIADPAFLAAVTGPSGTFDLIIRVETTQTGCTGPCGPSGSATWTGDVTVQFAFDRPVNDVPGPAPLAFFCAGLAALGVVRRRKA